LNIWGGSNLQKQFLDGSWSANVDFNFNIGEYSFSRFWILVDGIYPEISRFVKTHPAPLTRDEHIFAKWQEAAQKDIERAFCVLQRKFNILVRKVERWHTTEIRDVVEACIMLHNWMVTI
jgi:Plant transposon protein